MYFSDREFGPVPQTSEQIGEQAWGGIYALLMGLIADGSFGWRFPDTCPDGNGPIGVDQQLFQLAAAAEVPSIPWPISPSPVPPTVGILDLLEFACANVAAPIATGFHPFFKHHHLSFDRDEGVRRFVESVNRLFVRSGLAFEMLASGQVRRILPDVLKGALNAFRPRTGDRETDELLERARQLIIAPKLENRRDSLEKLWDAFERIKTLEEGADKAKQAESLLDKVTRALKFRAMIEDESKLLTQIGNRFRIRHSETTQESLESTLQVDYLFHRMFAFIHLLLTATGKVT